MADRPRRSGRTSRSSADELLPESVDEHYEEEDDDDDDDESFSSVIEDEDEDDDNTSGVAGSTLSEGRSVLRPIPSDRTLPSSQREIELQEIGESQLEKHQTDLISSQRLVEHIRNQQQQQDEQQRYLHNLENASTGSSSSSRTSFSSMSKRSSISKRGRGAAGGENGERKQGRRGEREAGVVQAQPASHATFVDDVCVHQARTEKATAAL